MTESTDIQILEARVERLKSDLADAQGALDELRTQMDKGSWERGVLDGFRTGIRRLCPDTADPYSYWAGWSEGDAARHGEEVTADVARICRPLSRADGAGDPMDCQPPESKASGGARRPEKAWREMTKRDIYAVLDAIAYSHAPLRTLKTCQKCGWTRQIVQRQLFTPDGEPRRYEPLIDSGCPRCHREADR